MIDRLFSTNTDPKSHPERHYSPPPDDDIHRFNELLDMIDRPANTHDYTVPLEQQNPVQKPTQSVVEMHHPKLTQIDPEEVIDTQNVPGAGEVAQVKVKEAVSQV